MERGIARRRLPHQHANRPARTSHFLAVLLMPRCLVKHSLHPVHGVFRTLSAYFSGVFLSECLWNAVSSQPGAGTLWEHITECGIGLPDLPGDERASSRMEGTEKPPGTSQKSCSSGPHLQFPGTDSSWPLSSRGSQSHQPATQGSLGTLGLRERRARGISLVTLMLPLLWGIMQNYAPFGQLAAEFS